MEILYKMINRCYISGKIVNKIDLKFIYNEQTKSIGKKHVSVIELDIELDIPKSKQNEKNSIIEENSKNDKNIIKAITYDEIADNIYQNLQQGNYICIEGKMRENVVEIITYVMF